MVSLINTKECFQVYLYLQCNFSKDMSDQIFQDMSDHLYNKWLVCNGNMLNFITCLDNNNINKLLSHAICKLNSQE